MASEDVAALDALDTVVIEFETVVVHTNPRTLREINTPKTFLRIGGQREPSVPEFRPQLAADWSVVHERHTAAVRS